MIYFFCIKHAAVALSALINGMYELNTVAIVRYCRAKNAAPKLGFLAPHIKQDYEVDIFFLLTAQWAKLYLLWLQINISIWATAHLPLP